MGHGTGVTALRDELRQIAFARVDRFVTVEDGKTVLAEAPPWEEYGGAVQQIKQGVHGVEVKFYDKQRALEKLIDLQQARQQEAGGAAGLRRVLQCLRKELAADGPGREADDAVE